MVVSAEQIITMNWEKMCKKYHACTNHDCRVKKFHFSEKFSLDTIALADKARAAKAAADGPG